MQIDEASVVPTPEAPFLPTACRTGTDRDIAGGGHHAVLKGRASWGFLVQAISLGGWTQDGKVGSSPPSVKECIHKS